MATDKPGFLAELKRRNVLRAAVLYAGAVWALSQGVSQLSPAIGLPDYATRWFLIAAVIAFPFWIAFAWFYEFTPQGFKRESEVAIDTPQRQSQSSAYALPAPKTGAHGSAMQMKNPSPLPEMGSSAIRSRRLSGAALRHAASLLRDICAWRRFCQPNPTPRTSKPNPNIPNAPGSGTDTVTVAGPGWFTKSV